VIPRNRNGSLDQQIGNPFHVAGYRPMERESYEFTVEAEDQATAGRGAQALADALREADGVLEADRRKADGSDLTLGSPTTTDFRAVPSWPRSIAPFYGLAPSGAPRLSCPPQYCAAVPP
jgi:hypothetical protein